MQTIKVNNYNEIPDNYTGIVEWANGGKSWYVKGKRHRLGGPAGEYADGTRAWYVDDKWHRLDGPAIEWADGGKSWYVDDVEVSESEYPEAVLLWKCKQVIG